MNRSILVGFRRASITRATAGLFAILAPTAAHAQEVTLPRVTYGSSGWKYTIVATNGLPGFEAPGFNDGGWSAGTAPWGTGGYCSVPYQTAWNINTDLLVRRVVDVPPNGRVRIAAKIDNDIIAYVNGPALGPLAIFDGCGGGERFSAISPPLAGGPVVVAIRARDRGGESHFDARIEVVFTADCNADGTVDYGQVRNGSLPDVDGNNRPDCCDDGVPCVLGRYPVQWRTAEGGNGHWYRLLGLDPGQSPEAHFDEASARGGHTATISSAAENEVCFRVMAGSGAIIGLRKHAGTNLPEWITGEPFGYANWFSGEGGNSWERYALLPAAWGGGWLDTDTTPRNFSLVEWSADCDADGVVDYGQILRGEVPDVNGNGVPDACECPADLDRDGAVAAEDLAAVLFAWGMSGGKAGSADVDRSGNVDGIDLAAVLAAWGPCAD